MNRRTFFGTAAALASIPAIPKQGMGAEPKQDLRLIIGHAGTATVFACSQEQLSKFMDIMDRTKWNDSPPGVFICESETPCGPRVAQSLRMEQMPRIIIAEKLS